MHSQFWFLNGILLIYGKTIDTQIHKHNAIQIIWPSVNNACQINASPLDNAIIISAETEHQLMMQRGWIILVEPQSQCGEQLLTYLNTASTSIIHGLNAHQSSDLSMTSKPTDVLDIVFNALTINTKTTHLNQRYVAKDKRIAHLQTQLDQCFKGTCIKPEKWSAADVANQLALSESRFLHLFKQEMKIAWRPYLLWRRLLCAVSSMHIGQSATDAAYQSGFADSAHLSRTFKAMFGITIRQAQANFKKT